ncbi:hypothetical protein K466DRAFT_604559 [Polyporus arcularius HHB13444]|uniref:Uncharacterized protein n=1 Tax=Polyporus arcularius HHB13444 TaxID=1314778 RepID=A0A5C3NVH3_9APHY|nr:hypothetical protein K466DRAFT_604559 [Polyporus arcularius HHB13444]
MAPPRLLLQLPDIERVRVVAASVGPPLAARELARRPCAQRGKHLVEMCYGLTEDETVGMLIEKCLALFPCVHHNTHVEQKYQMPPENRLRLLDKLINLEPRLPREYVDRCSHLRPNIIAPIQGTGHAETTQRVDAHASKPRIPRPPAAPSVYARAISGASGTTAADPIIVSDSDSEGPVATSRKRKRGVCAECSGEQAIEEGATLSGALGGSRTARAIRVTKRQRAHRV